MEGAPQEKKPRTDSSSSLGVAPRAEDVVYPSAATDAIAYEREHVHNVYSAIADHFSGTRYKAWPRVGAFLEALPPYALIADVGCGNGKYFAAAQRLAVSPAVASASPPEGDESADTAALTSSTVATRRYVVGLDYSEELLRCTQRALVDPNMHHEQSRHQHRSRRARKLAGDAVTPVSVEELPRTDTLRSDAMRCPLRAGTFDAAISIAVIHHYASRQRRVRAVRELLRLVRPEGGIVLLYVWAREQSGRSKRPIDPETGDGLVRWERNQKYDQEQQVFHRYYHFFAEGELEELCAEAAQGEGDSAAIPIDIRESYYDKENWCAVVVRK